MKKNIIFLILFLGIIIFFIYKKINHNTVITPIINGRIINLTTGRGIENAIVKAKWIVSSRYLIAYPSESYEYIAITDKFGNFLVPEHKSLHLLTSLNSILIDVSHPLYADLNNNYILGKDIKNSDVYFDIKISEIEEQFFEEEEFEKFWNKIEKYENGAYFKILNKYNISYNLNDIFNEWNKIAEKIDNILNNFDSKFLNKNTFQEKVKAARKNISQVIKND